MPAGVRARIDAASASVRGRGGGARQGRTGSRDEDVDAAELLLDGSEAGLDGSLVSDVDAEAEGGNLALLNVAVLLWKRAGARTNEGAAVGQPKQ